VQRLSRALVGIAVTVVISPLVAAFVPPLDAAFAGPASGAANVVRGGDGGARTAPVAKDPGCIYGKVLDGHSGAVRCLSSEEISPPGPHDIPRVRDGGVDASGRSSADRGRPRDAGGVDVAVADVASALRAVAITVDSVNFENGDVPRAQAALERFAKKEMPHCATDHDWRAGGRRSGEDAHLDLRFLVRAPGRAEGIDVSGARGLSTKLVQCITSALAGRPIGAPSADPVAVTVRFGFR
jgi:hypothetical protein